MSEMQTGSRDKILRRVREALRLSAPERHLGGHGSEAGSCRETHPGDRSEEWLPPVPDDLEGQIGLFAELSEGLQTEFVRVGDLAEARQWLEEKIRMEGWKRLATHGHPLLDAFWRDFPLNAGMELLRTDGGYEKPDLESCEAGITGCESLVAQTGTLVVTPVSSGGRVLSVLPPHHVVLATESQVCRDLKEALRRVREAHAGVPRYISFITGPSRTGDIERILVLGAHGPRRLSVLLLPG